jgi:ubiquinone/menaquinone biosynthesis C-methylase UbiE
MNHTPDAAKTRPPGAGKSSFALIDADRLFQELPLRQDMLFLDLGCGAGDYTLAVAEAIGKHGVVVALDLWEQGIETLQERAAAAGRNNLRPLQVDISKRLPVGDASVDLCLMATVLHDLVESGAAAGALKEAQRVLKPGGALAIVEFDKVAGPPGPPLEIRLTPEEVENLAAPYGFQKSRLARIGPYNYLLLFTRGEA